jgi:hypothetical protein
MPYCPNCGKELRSVAKYCPACGTELKGVEFRDKTGGINWFQRHLNWTFVLAVLGGYGIAVGVSVFLLLADPTTPDFAFNMVFLGIMAAVTIPVGIWVLRQKGRKLWWFLILFIPFGWIWFLMLDNHGYLTKPDNEIRKRCIEYLKEEAKIKGYRQKTGELFADLGNRYAWTAHYDSQDFNEFYNAASQLAQSSDEIIKRRSKMQPLPDEATNVYALWQQHYMDYRVCAKTQLSELSAWGKRGYVNERLLEKLLKQSDKSAKRAFREETRLYDRLRLSVEERQEILDMITSSMIQGENMPKSSS